MKTKILLRIAAGCLLFFALGHCIGHLTRHQVTDPKAKEVLQIMSSNKFDMFGQMRSYDENYTGMSFNLIITLITITIIVWLLSGSADKQAKLTRNLLIPIVICVLGFSITGFLYFFLMPAITCLIASIIITIGILKLKTENT
jgi:hypothetical protein